MTDKSKSTKINKRRCRKKQKINKASLEFVESPYDGEKHLEDLVFPGSPIELPTVKIDCHSSSHWVSPQVTTVVNGKYSLRSSMRSQRTQKKSRATLKRTNNLHSDISEDECANNIYQFSDDYNLEQITKDKQNKFRFESCLQDVAPVFVSPQRTSMYDSEPVLPLSISTPEMLQTIDLESESYPPEQQFHYLFQGKTPVLKHFTILAEDTPL